MATNNPNPFAQKTVSKTLSTLPGTATNIFTVSGGPVQLVMVCGFVESTIGGTSYTGYVRASNGSGTRDFSNAVTLTGMTGGTVLDMMATFDTPPSGNPRVDIYGVSLFYIPAGDIQFVPGGTAGDGVFTVSLAYIPMTPSSKITVV